MASRDVGCSVHLLCMAERKMTFSYNIVSFPFFLCKLLHSMNIIILIDMFAVKMAEKICVSCIKMNFQL